MQNNKKSHVVTAIMKSGKYRGFRCRPIVDVGGFTLLEIIVSIAIFSVIVAGIYGAFIAQMKHSTREYKIAESEMELGIAKNIIERDLSMAGYGLAEDYGSTGFTPRVATITGTPYALTLTGTGLGMRSRATQGWTYVAEVDGSNVPTFQTWSDARENVRTDADNSKKDAVIVMEPTTKILLDNGAGTWLFRYNGPNAQLTDLSGNPYTGATVGTLVYGLDQAATQPYYAVRYYLDNTSNPSACAPGTFSLLRAESVTTGTPAGGDRILACVRDFQAVFDLDSNGDGTIDQRDSDGTLSGTSQYNDLALKKAIKQMHLYLLVQTSNRDFAYTYPDQTVRVGNSSLGTGHDITLTDEQRRYRWRLVSINVTPRNIR